MVDEWTGQTNVDAAADEAVAWHLRLPGAGAEEWHAFTDWLEADPAHGDAYDALTRADAELDDALTPPDWSDTVPFTAANDDRAAPRRRWALAAFGGLPPRELAS
ncbi:DUF4880 domain-containing protein [Sphingomonas aurantiaca]|uniref:DUF4880 domain-containing protein n=1 Tax=Sphingomonas aurantiaca TaxID=185949 RepID=UPI002FE1C3B7